MNYAEFKRLGIDLGALGAEGGRNAVRYTCTPKGAKIFGWAGVDGIHFCTVKGYGEKIFAVSPMNPGRDCVQPIARDMDDFLRLLLACGDTAALEQAWMWDEAQFEDFLRENPPTEAQRAVMREIEEKCGLTPMERPWWYLKEVREETDCTGLRFEKEYEELLHPAVETLREWAVYYECGFGGKRPRRRPGREVALGKTFTWGGEEWLAPAMYCCGEGLVLDLLKKVPAEVLNRFAEKWGLDENGAPQRELTPAEQEKMRLRDHERLKQMTFYSTTPRCLRHFILNYFGEDSPAECGKCSSCNAEMDTLDITVEAQKVISCVYRLKQRGRSGGMAFQARR